MTTFCFTIVFKELGESKGSVYLLINKKHNVFTAKIVDYCLRKEKLLVLGVEPFW